MEHARRMPLDDLLAATALTPPLPPLYSYIRFSTPEQRLGESEKRQLEGTIAYAAKLGRPLDTNMSMRDLGRSGTGEHRYRGALGRFLQRVENDELPWGAGLVIESIDRISRMLAWDALSMIMDMTKRGIEIHVLENQQVYTHLSLNGLDGQTGEKWILLGELERAHRESERKAFLSGSTWKNRKDMARKYLRPINKRCPGWLVVKEKWLPEEKRWHQWYEPIPERCEVVERIVHEAGADGLRSGMGTIARRLNEDGIPPFDGTAQNLRMPPSEKGWSVSYVQKILHSRALLGTYQPMRREAEIEKDERKRRDKITDPGEPRRKVPDGDPIEHYYPQVVYAEAWDKAKAVREGRKPTGGRNTGGHRNLLRGLARCATCGGAMHQIAEGPPEGHPNPDDRRSRDWLVRYNAKRGHGCQDGKRLDYRAIERRVLAVLGGLLLDPMAVAESDDAALRGEITDAYEALARLRRAGAKWAAEFEADNPLAKERINAIAAEMAPAQARLEAADAALRQAKLRQPRDHLLALERLRGDALHPDPAVRLPARSRIAAALEALIDGVRCRGDGSGVAVVTYGGGRLSFAVNRDGSAEHFPPKPWPRSADVPKAEARRFMETVHREGHAMFPGYTPARLPVDLYLPPEPPEPAGIIDEEAVRVTEEERARNPVPPPTPEQMQAYWEKIAPYVVEGPLPPLEEDGEPPEAAE